MKSTNGLQSVSKVYEDPALDQTQQMLDIEIAESNPNVVWACAKGYFLYKSTDGGNAFTKITALRDSIYQNTMTVNNAATRKAPAQFTLEPNYPNPFNPATIIHFSLSRAEPVTLKVFDTFGREVATLIEGELAAGPHQAVFDAATPPTGVYFYRLTASAFSQTRKMVLMR